MKTSLVTRSVSRCSAALGPRQYWPKHDIEPAARRRLVTRHIGLLCPLCLGGDTPHETYPGEYQHVDETYGNTTRCNASPLQPELR